MNMMGIRSFSPLRQWMARRGWIGVSPVNRLTLMASGDVAPRSMGTLQIKGMMISSNHDFAAWKTIYTVCQAGPSKNGLYPSKRDINYRFYGRNSHMPDFRVCESFDDVLQLALEHLDQLRPNEIAVVWTFLSRTLLKWRPHQMKNIDLHSYNVETAQYELQLVDHILERTFFCLDEMSARDVTTITLAMAKIVQHIRNRPQKKRNAAQQAFRNVFFDETLSLNDSIFYDLADHSNRILPHCEARHLSNLAYAHALLEYDPEFDDGSTLLAKIADESIGWMNEFNAQGISNMAWAYATLGILNQELFVAMGNAVSERRDLNEFIPQNLSNIVWAYATADVQHPGLFKRVGDNIDSMKDLKTFTPQNLANIVWAYATAGQHHHNLLKKIGDNIATMKDLKSFLPQNLSNIVWAYATANEHHPGLFEKIGYSIESMNNLKSFQPQELSNIVWAFATANVHHPGLFKIVGDNIDSIKDLKAFNPQNLANVVWAFATANVHHPGLFKIVGDNIDSMKDLKSFNGQDFANIVWAYATANVHHPNLIQKIGDNIDSLKDLKSFKPQELSNIVWAYATLNVYNPNLFRKIGDNVVNMKDLKSFNSQNLANIVWAYATANEEHLALLDKVGSSIIDLNVLSSFNSQELTNTAWAYSVMNFDATLLLQDAFIEALEDNEQHLTTANCSQLYQWHLWQTHELSKSGLPTYFQEKCFQAFSSGDTTVSALQRDVVTLLDFMGLKPAEEYLTNSGYRLDALIEIGGKKVGIEVDGPSHFIGRRPNGSTVLKHRQVEAIDKIPLVSVPYWEWIKLKKDRNKKKQYLESLLEFAKLS